MMNEDSEATSEQSKPQWQLTEEDIPGAALDEPLHAFPGLPLYFTAFRNH